MTYAASHTHARAARTRLFGRERTLLRGDPSLVPDSSIFPQSKVELYLNCTDTESKVEILFFFRFSKRFHTVHQNSIRWTTLLRERERKLFSRILSTYSCSVPIYVRKIRRGRKLYFCFVEFPQHFHAVSKLAFEDLFRGKKGEATRNWNFGFILTFSNSTVTQVCSSRR